ncbi:uncharacterized protein LOC125479920 [Pyrus x bretschneideri]|uniref:uncharacterized protein LOC125479920 n=1 Tax=Pyrus x bretschneideri TaxID=225117 RepID=UPI00202FED73|nr:uncharacterized protein LOC125479920 [Pyrus x bretschneideri]
MISDGWLVERGRKGREVEVKAAERESNVKDREQRGSDGDKGRGESGDGVGGKGFIYNKIEKVEEKTTKVLGVSSFKVMELVGKEAIWLLNANRQWFEQSALSTEDWKLFAKYFKLQTDGLLLNN